MISLHVRANCMINGNCMINAKREGGQGQTGATALGAADVDSTLVTAYLDHAATTPMLPEAIEAMTAELALAGNASSLHTSGRRARRVVEEAREQLAAAVGAGPSEVVFTAGGTEADNLAVKGLFWARREAGPAPAPGARRRRRAPRRARPRRVAGGRRGRGGRVAAGRRARAGRRRGRTGEHRARPRQRGPGHGACGPTTRSAPSSRSRSSPRSRTSTASPCTATPCRPSASCRSTSRRARSTASR